MEDLKIRYSRQVAIPEIGTDGQHKISNAKVLIVGAGALGSMVAMQLAGAGVGCLGIADYDNIDVTNLQRQFFYTEKECGKPKVYNLVRKIKALNHNVKVIVYSNMMTRKKAEEIFIDYDFIIDATDNPSSKEITGNVSKEKNKPCCIAGVRDFEGQVMTFLPEDLRFEDFFGKVMEGGFLPCSISGVIGPAAALAASIQVSETLKYIIGRGKMLNKKILTFNLLNTSFNIIHID